MFVVMMVMVMNLFLFGFFSFFMVFFDDFDVVVEDCCDDGDYISFNNVGVNIFGVFYIDVDDILEGKILFLYVYYIFVVILFEDVD